MTKNKKSSQLRLAADILDTGHPWKFKGLQDQWYYGLASTPDSFVASGQEIRLEMVSPPNGQLLHNPDNLSADQVGAGYRLLTQEEFAADQHLHHYEWYSVYIPQQRWNLETETARTRDPSANCGTTFRVPISCPWYEAPKIDPNAEVKVAFEAGKIIQFRYKNDAPVYWTDDKATFPAFDNSQLEFRVKPELPLNCGDIPFGSVFRLRGTNDNWFAPISVTVTGVRFYDHALQKHVHKGWALLMAENEVNQSIPLAGKWNEKAWGPCSKYDPKA